jgi:plasmid maintenance system antidote protein VapI
MDIDTAKLGRQALTDALRQNAGLKASHVSHLVNGSKSPSLSLALQIEETTGIPPSFWREPDRGAAMWKRIQETQP